MRKRISQQPPYAVRTHPVHRIIELPGIPLVVFLTINVDDILQPWLATPEGHAAMRAIWESATAWQVGCYMLMPDHLHNFVTRGDLEIPLDRWVHYWKSQLTRLFPGCNFNFQEDYWDTTIRSSQHYSEKLEYMRQNPVRRRLVERPEDWPYQGTIHEFTWLQTK